MVYCEFPNGYSKKKLNYQVITSVVWGKLCISVPTLECPADLLNASAAVWAGETDAFLLLRCKRLVEVTAFFGALFRDTREVCSFFGATVVFFTVGVLKSNLLFLALIGLDDGNESRETLTLWCILPGALAYLYVIGLGLPLPLPVFANAIWDSYCLTLLPALDFS